MKNLLLLKIFAALFALGLTAHAQVLVGGAPGTANVFGTRPASTDWSTRSLVGADTAFGSGAALLAALQTNTAAAIASQVLDFSATNPPAQNALASWTSGGTSYVQTRATGNGATLLMATLRNNLGLDATTLRITYNLTAGGTTLAEQIASHQVYYSQSGATGSWVSVAALTGGTAGSRSNTVALAGTWANNALLYVVWADDNATGGTDNGWQLDDVVFTAGNAPVPLSVILTAPANGALALPPTNVTLSASTGGSVPPASVAFFTNGVLFANLTTPPYTASITLLNPVTNAIHAVAMNAGETAFSATNILRVRDEFVHYTGGTNRENFDSVGAAGVETPLGWYVGSNVTAATMSLMVGDGSLGPNAAIDGWNYGTAAAPANRSLGTAPTGTDRNTVLRLQNNTGSNILAFEVRYDGEVWRHHTTTNEWLTNYVSLDRGVTWIATGFDFQSPVAGLASPTALDGHNAANRVAGLGGLITPANPIPPGGLIYIRWHNFNDLGTDGALALDNFSFRATQFSAPVPGLASYFTTPRDTPLILTAENLPSGPVNAPLHILSTSGGSQGGTITLATSWTNRYNGTGNGDDLSRTVLVDANGNAVVAGYSVGNVGDADYLTIKYAPNGTALWTARFNAPANSSDYAGAAALDGSGNVFVTGLSIGSGTGFDFSTIKQASAGGALVWESRYNQLDNSYDSGLAVAVDGSGNVAVTGTTYDGTADDYVTIKYTANGTPIWNKRYSGPAGGYDQPAAVAVDGSGNVVVTGYSSNGTNDDYLTIKYAADGTPVWTNRYNSPTNGVDQAKAVAVDNNGDVIVTGGSASAGGSFDYYTAKYAAANGALLWEQRYSRQENTYDYAKALGLDSAGNIVVTGVTYDGHDDDLLTIKYAPNGTPLWTNRYNGPIDGADQPIAVVMDSSGTVWVTGYSANGANTDYLTVKYAADGTFLWEQRYDGPNNGNDEASSVAVDALGNAYVTGKSVAVGGTFDYATIKYPFQERGLRYVPAPGFSGLDTFAFTVLDALGQTYAATVGVAVVSAPAITQQPQNLIVPAGTNVALSVAGTGYPVPSFQWRLNGFALAGATNTALSLGSAATNLIGSYSVVISNSLGVVTSAVVTLSVYQPSLAIADSVSTPVNVILTNRLASLLGNDLLGFGVPTNPPLQILSASSGAQGGTTTLASAQGELRYAPPTGFAGLDTFTYTLADAFGQTSTATVSVSVISAPMITQQPQNFSVLAGSNVTFSITAPGYPPPAYQWRLNGTDLAGATNATLVLNGVTTNQLGNYLVVVSNSVGVVTSAVASLIFYLPSMAVADSFSTLVNNLLTISLSSLLANDILGFGVSASPPLTVLSASQGSQGGTTTLASAQGQLRYAPPTGFTGLDTFTYTLMDAFGQTSTATGSVSVVVPPKPDAYVFSTLAGRASTGSADGVGDAAQFKYPKAIAVDNAGTVYVVDNGNYTIRKITAAGEVSTFAGLAGSPGTNDGTGIQALFDFPPGIDYDENYNTAGIAVDLAGNLYVSDRNNHTIRKITPAGVVSTFAGSSGHPGTNDGAGSNARFNFPSGIAVDSDGEEVYVADWGNHRIRKISAAGVVSTFTVASGGPGIAVESAGNVYVTGVHTILKVTPSGVVTTLAGSDGEAGDANGYNARFYFPAGLAVDSADNVYVADTGNHTIRKIPPDGEVITLAGLPQISGSIDSTGIDARFNGPHGVAVDIAGNLYVPDTRNSAIRKLTSAGVVSSLAGSRQVSGNPDATGSNARFNEPLGITTDTAGNLYVSDRNNHTIRKITSAGLVSTIAGLHRVSGTSDGTGSNARFTSPSGITVDTAGNLYVADWGNHKIRKITPAGVVNTIVSGTSPSGIAVDIAGNLYVEFNRVLRKITPVGNNWVVSAIAGVSEASAIAVDGATNLYVAGGFSHTILKLTPVGNNWVVSTLAGLAGSPGTTDGAGSNARFANPSGIAVDGAGNVYVSDGVHTIRKINSAGVVTTIGGLPDQASSENGTGNKARFNNPIGVAVDLAGNLYVADSLNNTIRKGVFTAYGSANAVAYVAPPMNGQLTVTLLPPEANGQWRFPWEFGWHHSGDTVSNLVAGNYPVEFRTLSGWLAIPLSAPLPVPNGEAVSITNEYYPTITGGDGSTTPGSLTVLLGSPQAPVGAGWRFLGDATPFLPHFFTTNLPPGTYLIEFASVSGRVKPPSQAVLVSAGAPAFLSVSYQVAPAPPANVFLPFPVPANQLSDETTFPFGFNGQLQSDLGYGSGVAVETNVVLTAAHLVFNDATLSYVSHAHWFFRRDAGVTEPLPLAARGWYVLSGYAAQRTNDVPSLGVDSSSPQSRNLDVAALYFLQPAAGGGHGGYLPSDNVPNTWLSSTVLKMLVGYPVDGSQFGASITAGKMYQTLPQPYPLNLANDPVLGQQEVYEAPWFLSYPGNSGGPLYVQLNGYYYPAGVYLGTRFSGTVPVSSFVRAIDSNVVNLITRAAAQGDSGTNFTGGGVITIVPSPNINAGNNKAYLQVRLAPPAAVRAGAGWKLPGDPDYGSDPNYIRQITSTVAFAVQFKPIPGWNLPVNQSITVYPNGGVPNLATGFYAVVQPALVNNSAAGLDKLGMTGTTGTVYRLERKSALTNAAWQAVGTHTIRTNGFNPVLTNPPAGFYRLQWLP